MDLVVCRADAVWFLALFGSLSSCGGVRHPTLVGVAQIFAEKSVHVFPTVLDSAAIGIAAARFDSEQRSREGLKFGHALDSDCSSTELFQSKAECAQGSLQIGALLPLLKLSIFWTLTTRVVALVTTQHYPSSRGPRLARTTPGCVVLRFESSEVQSLPRRTRRSSLLVTKFAIFGR